MCLSVCFLSHSLPFPKSKDGLVYRSMNDPPLVDYQSQKVKASCKPLDLKFLKNFIMPKTTQTIIISFGSKKLNLMAKSTAMNLTCN